MKWILCDERLPEEGQMVLTTMVLTTIRGHDVIIPQEGETLEEAIERIWNDVCYVSIGFIGSDGWYGADGFPEVIHPIAWMPLPKPYTADRKTEPSNSEKPNNCETCKYGEDKHRYAHVCNECGVGINNYEPKDNSTISKMEQVDKDINVRSKDEPTTQTETQNSNLTFEKRTMRDCYNCKRYETEGECIECHYEPKDEPQDECAKEYEELGLKELKELIEADRKTENSSEKPNNSTISKMEQVDEPQTCDTCKYGEDKHRYAHVCNECGVGINNYEPKDNSTISKMEQVEDEPKTQMKTQNSNLTFEKADEPQTKLCRECDDYAGDGMYCASNHIVYDFSTSKGNCEPQTDCPYDSRRDYEYDLALEQMERDER